MNVKTDIELIENDEEIVDEPQEEEDTEPVANIDDMIDRIANDDNVGAKTDFETLISNKLNAALDARKQEIAQSLYADQDEDDDGSEPEQGAEVEDEVANAE